MKEHLVSVLTYNRTRSSGLLDEFTLRKSEPIFSDPDFKTVNIVHKEPRMKKPILDKFIVLSSSIEFQLFWNKRPGLSYGIFPEKDRSVILIYNNYGIQLYIYDTSDESVLKNIIKNFWNDD